MVSFLRYIFLTLLAFLCACTKGGFKLDINLSPEITGNYNVIYFATDVKGGLTIQAVASVREGKCLLDGFTKRPLLAYISDRRYVLPLVVYIKNGEKVNISGAEKDPFLWNVKGNEINAMLTQWRLEHPGLQKANSPDSVNMAVKTFVEAHPDNPASAILMLNYFDRKADEKLYADLMRKLEGEAKNPEWLKISSRADQLTARYKYPASLESLVMRSDKEGADTLIMKDNYPALLVFWQKDPNDKVNYIDSLRKLEKDYKDSTRIIADIFVDLDSVAWINTIKRDSLKTVKRFWAPTGQADASIMKFKIGAMPYFIVFNKDGEQSYRGTDLESAMKEYRKLMDNKMN